MIRFEDNAWHRDFMDSVIEPILLPAASELIDSHRNAGHHLLIITATNEFITRPIASRLGIEDLIACEAEIIDGKYTVQIPHGGDFERMFAVTDHLVAEAAE